MAPTEIATPWQQLSIRQILQDGAILTGVLGSLVIGSALYEPEMWLPDYPPPIRERFGPMSRRAKRARRAIIAPLLVAIAGVPIWSNRRLSKRNQGQVGFPTMFVNTLALYELFNAVDFVVFDCLLFARWRPAFVELPGTEGMAAYNDVGFHARGWVKGCLLVVIPSLLVAWLSQALRPRR